jgi:type IV secretory pathway TraG/TraD family ATPase VirD4
MRVVGDLRGRPIRVPLESLRNHAYIVGGTGTGKSRLLRVLIEQDIAAGHGLCVIDPHGDLCDALIQYVGTLPKNHPALRRVVLIDPTDPEWAVGFNPLEVPPGDNPYPHILELITVFEKLWHDAWGARMEDILRNSLLTLAEHGLTLLEMPKLLTDEEFRSRLVADLESPEAQNYWHDRFEPLAARTRAEWIESSLNKVSSFISDPWIRDMVGQTHSTIDLRAWMDEGAITFVNLSKGRLKRNSDLVGALFVSKIQEAAMSRVDIPEKDRVPYRMFVDEFQNFATRSFEEILSEARKYGLSIIMANQTLEQLPKTLLASVLGNCTVQCYFRCSRADADILARQAFRATGKDIKFMLTRDTLFTHEPRATPAYVSVGEEMENYTNLILDLGKRQALLNLRGGGPPVPFHTLDAPDRRVDPRHAELRAALLARGARRRDLVRREIRARTASNRPLPVDNYWET